MAITFGAKGRFAQLQDRIEAAGHYARMVGGVYVCSDEPAVQAIIDSFTVADMQAIVKDEIKDHAEALLVRANRRTAPAEMAMWADKLAEAKAYTASGNAADAPYLALEATDRGVTLAALVTRVLNKADAAKRIEAAISGISGKHCDAIDARTTAAQIVAYNWRAGWPVVGG